MILAMLAGGIILFCLGMYAGRDWAGFIHDGEIRDLKKDVEFWRGMAERNKNPGPAWPPGSGPPPLPDRA